MAIVAINPFTKEYRLGSMQGLKETLINTASRLTGKNVEERPLFKALEDVSFSIEPAEGGLPHVLKNLKPVIVWFEFYGQVRQDYPELLVITYKFRHVKITRAFSLLLVMWKLGRSMQGTLSAKKLVRRLLSSGHHPANVLFSACSNMGAPGKVPVIPHVASYHSFQGRKN